MRYISLFSGIEAASVAWEPLGWEPVAFAEIEPFCCDLLAARFPNVPNLGDVSKVDWTPYEGMVDVIIGGSPCQAFSIAGQRKGLMDERGMLMLQYVRAVREVKPRFIVWENVPGVLSQDKGRAFGTLLGELEDCGYSLAWRVLDAQFFGVAQRRRRVFLVGHPVAGCAAAVLFEPESLRWDYPSSREAREGLARAARQRAQEGCGPIAFKYSAGAAARTMPTYEDGTCNTLTADWHAPAIAFNGTQTPTAEEDFAPCVTHEGACAAYGIYRDATPKVTEEVSPTLRVGGDGGSNLAVAYDCSRCGLRVLGASMHLRGSEGTMPCGEEECPRVRATAIRTANTGANGSGIADEVAHTIDTTGPEAVAFAQNTRDEVRLQGDGTISGALSAQPGMKQTTYVAQRVNAQASNGEEIVGALCARDYKGVGDEYVREGKVICQRLGSCGCDKGTKGGAKGPSCRKR